MIYVYIYIIFLRPLNSKNNVFGSTNGRRRKWTDVDGRVRTERTRTDVNGQDGRLLVILVIY